jgi:hypothetical protein
LISRFSACFSVAIMGGMKNLPRLMLTVCLCSAAACAPLPPEARVKYTGDYWQRTDTTSALYLRGPKAQQTLNQDVARCVREIEELEKLSAIRESIPADNRAGAPQPPGSPEGRLAQWDTPEREGEMYYEHLDYHDFETCMTAKGWERVDHMPYDIAEEARETYIQTIRGRKYRSKIGARMPGPPEPPPKSPSSVGLND